MSKPTVKIPRCLHFDSGWCYYDGFLKANILGVGFGGSTGCNGCFKCEVYKFEHNIKPCGVCGEGYLIPKVNTDGTHYSICTNCLSEIADAEQAKKNKEIYNNEQISKTNSKKS